MSNPLSARQDRVPEKYAHLFLEGKPTRQKRPLGMILIVTGIIGASVFFVSQGLHRAEKPAASAREVWQKMAMENMSLDFSAWKIDKPFLNVDFVLYNQNEFPVKDPRIVTFGFAESGTKLDSNERTVYKLIPPHESVRLSAFEMGIVDANVANVRMALDDVQPVQ